MIRQALLTALLLAMVLAPASLAIGYEMEGLLDEEQVSGLAPASSAAYWQRIRVGDDGDGELPDEWNCARPRGIVAIQRIELCRVMGADVGQEASVDVAGAAAGSPAVVGKDRPIRYRILIERGLEAEADTFIPRVTEILNRPTGWARNSLRFVHVTDTYDFTVVLAFPASVNRLCRPLRTGGQLSCAIHRRAVINADRWRGGAETWGADVKGYHHYLVNHEVGHVLGMRHLRCPGAEAPAPIMLPQTRFLEGCTANGVATPEDIAQFERILPRVSRRLAGAAPKLNRRRAKRSRRAKRLRWAKRSSTRRSRRRRR